MEKLTVTLEDRPVDIELAQYKRMFEAACSALAAIGDALGVDPEEGGAEPILAAIADLKASDSQPVKQKPMAWVDAKEEGYEFHGIGYLPVGKHHLYAAPVDAKAIRAEVLEEAAKVCDEQPRHSGDATTFYVATGQCAAAIRGLK